MWRKLAPFALLFVLTAPNGMKFMLAGEDIGYIAPSKECVDSGGKNEIRTATGTFCVTDSLEDLLAGIKKDSVVEPEAEAPEEK
jgi:hypothetical protein